MYLEPWQVFLGGCVIGTLISFIVLTAFLIKMIGQIGIKGIRISEQEDKDKVETDLISKLCFILLAKGYLDDIDNDFMLDRVAFNLWKEHVEEELAELEEEDKDK